MKLLWRIGGLALSFALGACVSGPPRRPPPAASAPTPAPTGTPAPVVGLDRVMGRTATQLVQLFGNPEQDLRERTARRLQFTGACVLDAYLYPPPRGGEAVVTHVDARLSNGASTDRAACIAALVRRR
ncbi:hypothetical protein [Sphingomonas quercus]|uniref:Lipoprotein n=1 Tax=Sphingomonas quercus TaxID=2842451 RepID=A0ABS6BJ28_9SPHN|nr:hypothetical protein [Sphingomonas quercus]MBU3078184.1 hypothetical protein [Sphingomonas quercus]